jgi:hypothetical protein
MAEMSFELEASGFELGVIGAGLRRPGKKNDAR